jgi:glycosyltransferase involved in cell wall biosynthesis
MKILMVLIGKSFPPDIRVEKEARTLINAGHEVLLACSRAPGQELETWYNGIRVLRFDYPRAIFRKIGSLQFYTTLHNSYWVRTLSGVISRMGIDAVHVHDLSGASYSALVAAKRGGRKTVLDLHENWADVMAMYADKGDLQIIQKLFVKMGFWDRYEKACLRRADHAVVTSQGMEERIMSLGMPANKITIMMNVEDIKYFLSLPIQKKVVQKYKNKFVLSYIGKLTFERGIQTVIQAVKLLKDKIPNILFVIIGDGPYEVRLRSLVATMKAEEFVEFIGWVDFQEVASYIAATDVGVLPQIVNLQTENACAHKVFQYMSFGKPIVTTPTKVYKQINDEKEFVLFVPYDDPESLSEAVMRLYQDEALRSRLGENGRQLTREKYDWRLMAGDLAKIYRTV